MRKGWQNSNKDKITCFLAPHLVREIKNILDEYPHLHSIHVQAKREKNNVMIYCVY